MPVLESLQLGGIVAAPEMAAPPKAKRRHVKQPTQRSLEYLRKLGYLADVVERWIPVIHKRKDLFGFLDILALNETEVLAVQTTSGDGGHVSARIQKIAEHENFPLVCKHMRIVVHGWRKNAKGKWVLREVELS